MKKHHITLKKILLATYLTNNFFLESRKNSKNHETKQLNDEVNQMNKQVTKQEVQMAYQENYV